MQSDIGLGIGVVVAQPSRIAEPTRTGKTMMTGSQETYNFERHSQTMPSRRKKTIQEETRSRMDSLSGSSEYFQPHRPSQSQSQAIAGMRSSKAMEGLLFAEAGASMVELDKLGSGRARSKLREGKPIEPGTVTPLVFPMPPVVSPAMHHEGSIKMRPRSRIDHVRGMSLDQGLSRQGTLLDNSPSAAPRRAEQLSVLLGDRAGRVKSGAVVPPRPRTISSYSAPVKNRSKISLIDTPNAVTFEQGRSHVRVALDIELENNVTVEGGYFSGTLLVRVRPKRKDDVLKLGGGKIRIAGFEVAPKNEDRCIFYQTATPLADISQGHSKLFNMGLDEEGFGCVAEGEYSVRFAMQIPLVGTGGKPRGVLHSRSGSGATIKYIMIASMKVFDPTTGKRSIAHFYRDCEVWPSLDPLTALSPSPDPMLARAAKKLFMGGDGTLALTASLHRSTWVAGQPIHVRLRIANDTKKSVRSVSLSIIRTTTLFKLDGSAQHRAVGFDDEMNEGETSTQEKRVAEAVLSAGQKGAKGRASAKGWWAGVASGETRNVTHSITIPSDALTIPRARLVEVDYAVRVALGVSSIAGTSEAVHVTLPIRVVNFISLDPPPSEPILAAPSTSVIELDTPRQNRYPLSDLGADGKNTQESLSDASTDGHCGEPIHTERRTAFKRTRANTLPCNTPPPVFPTAHTVHDLGSMEDADDLNGMLGDIPGSISILEETDITMDGADSGYSDGTCSNWSGAFGRVRRTKSGYLHALHHNLDRTEDNHDNFEYGALEEDVGSDEELERMVGCASARIDAGSFQHPTHTHSASRTSSSEMSGGELCPYERDDTSHPPSSFQFPKAGGACVVRGPRSMPGRGSAYQQSAAMNIPPNVEGIPVTRSMFPLANSSQHSFSESPDSIYSTSNSGTRVVSSRPSTPHAKRLRSTPSNHAVEAPYPYSQRSSSLPRPTASRTSAGPSYAHHTSPSHDSGCSSASLSTSPSRPMTGLPFPVMGDMNSRKAGGGASVRARIAALGQEGLMVESLGDARPGYISRSLTTSAVHYYS